MVQKEALAYGGTINGEATIENMTTQPVFVSDLTILQVNLGSKVEIILCIV
mgnify:CR=1 FL=1